MKSLTVNADKIGDIYLTAIKKSPSALYLTENDCNTAKTWLKHELILI